MRKGILSKKYLFFLYTAFCFALSNLIFSLYSNNFFEKGELASIEYRFNTLKKKMSLNNIMIVKIDDLGLYLTQKPSAFKNTIGRGLLAFAPKLMKTLTIVGTIAMFLVGGGIINHAVPWMHHFTEDAVQFAQELPTMSSIIGAITPTAINLVTGIVAGLLVLLVVHLIGKVRHKSTSTQMKE